MDDPLVMSVLHRVAYFRHQLEARGRVKTATAGVFVQGHPADELHGEERLAVLAASRFINLSDPRMLEPAQDLGFVAEAIEQLG